MKLSKENKKILNDEFKFAIKKMESSKTPDQMLYYFSGIHGMILRILNIEYSDDLLFVNFVLDRVHKATNERLHQIKSGDTVIAFHEKFGDKLIELTKRIIDCFYNKEARTTALKELVVLAYTTTGNGHYLTEKGLIDIFSDKKQIKEK